MKEPEPHSVNEPAPTLARRHEIDALRSIALFLLIGYHLFCAYQPFAPKIRFIGYENTLDGAFFLGEALNPWRIPVLFLIAGITSGYLLPTRSVGKLLRSRLLRLVPPVIFTVFLISPITSLLYQVYHGERTSYVPGPGHLWFVWNLAVYFVFAAPLFLYCKKRPSNFLVSTVRFLAPWSWLILFPALLVVVTLFLEPYVNDDLFAAHFLRFWFGFICFLSGTILVSLGDGFWKGLRPVCHLALPIALTLYLLRMAEIDFGGSLPTLIARTVEAFSAMLGFLGYGTLIFTKPSRIFSVVNRSVFAIYIIHLPVQQALALFLFRLDWNPWAMVAVHLLLTLCVCALIYTLILRPLRWLHPFFGIAPTRANPPLAEASQTSPSRSVRFARGTILYVVTPLMVLLSIIGIVFSFLRQPGFDTSGKIDKSNPFVQATISRFEDEIASQSPEENQNEIAALKEERKAEREAEREGRVEFLTLEIKMIEQALRESAAATEEAE